MPPNEGNQPKMAAMWVFDHQKAARVTLPGKADRDRCVLSDTEVFPFFFCHPAITSFKGGGGHSNGHLPMLVFDQVILEPSLA